MAFAGDVVGADQVATASAEKEGVEELTDIENAEDIFPGDGEMLRAQDEPPADAAGGQAGEGGRNSGDPPGPLFEAVGENLTQIVKGDF